MLSPCPERLEEKKDGRMSEDSPLQRVMSGESWEDFCDALKGAGQTILAEGSPDNPLDRAEGYRYLSRLTRAALEAFLEYADPWRRFFIARYMRPRR